MSGLEKSLFQLKFTAKSLQRQANKATRDEGSEKAKVKRALAQGNVEGAQIYASTAIRKKNEALGLLRLSSRIDAVASRVEAAVAMRQVSGNMSAVVRGMDRAMQTMDLDQITGVMDRFERQFDDMDVQSSYMESAMGSSTAAGMPQDQVDALMQQVADEHGIEMDQQLGRAGLAGRVPELPTQTQAQAAADADDALAQRLRALRPAT